MRVTVVQMNPGADKAANIAQAEKLIGSAVAEDKQDIVSLPEVWDSLGGDRTMRNANAETLPAQGVQRTRRREAYAFMRELARRHQVHVHGGSIIEKGPEKLFNTTVVFNPDGDRVGALSQDASVRHYRAPDGHADTRKATRTAPVRKSLPIRPATSRLDVLFVTTSAFRTMFWKLREQGADLIFLPSAFPLATGKDHWEALIRARAIETQCWVAAPATWGKHLEGKGEARFTYGHSMIADPWGHTVAKVSDGTGWATARLDPKVTARVRRDMPVLEHRKRV